MKRTALIKKVLNEFNGASVRYCVLRNYEFLHSKVPAGFDFDISIAKEDQTKAEHILFKNSFLKKPQQFSRKHQGYAAFSKEELLRIGFDIQWNGIVWNDMYYLGPGIYERRKKFKGFYVLSSEDAFIMYLCHSVLGKRHFKEKYKQKLRELAKKKLDFKAIAVHLSTIFHNGAIGPKLINLVHEEKFDSILKIKNNLIRRFILRNQHTLLFTKLFFRWINEKVLPHKYPVIAFIGPDGAGKSTTTEKIVRILRENDRPVSYVYLGRGKSHLLPINKTGRAVYNKIRSTPKIITKLIYYAAAPIYTLDLLLRYATQVRPKRKRSIIVTDRYATDIYLMPNVSHAFRSFLFSLFPKPTLTFYLYNDAKTLYERKKQQSQEELQKQLDLFDNIAAKLNAVRIKTDSQKIIEQVARRTFEHLAGYQD